MTKDALLIDERADDRGDERADDREDALRAPLCGPRAPVRALAPLLLLAACGGGGGGGGGVQPPTSDVPATIRNLQRASSEVATASGYTLFSVPEAGQGGTDLNGDGDALDRVLFVHDTTTGNVVSLGLAVTDLVLTSGSVGATLVREVSQGGDLNGDGDLQDDVLHLVRKGAIPSGIVVTNTELSATPDVSLGGRWVAFHVREPSQGADLNGDMDLEDDVLFLYDLDLGVPVNTGLVLAGELARDGNVLAAVVSEPGSGADLNADGDEDDLVLHVLDLDAGTTQNLQLALGTAAGGDPGTVRVSGSTVTFFVSEAAQGATDLNGDMVVQDFVLFSYDAVTGQTTNLLRDNVIVRGSSDLLALSIAELSEGVDLNGDGDILDRVLFVKPAGSDQLQNLGLATVDFVVRGPHVLFTVGEFFQQEDLNGDGDMFDDVLHVFDLASGNTTNLGIAVDGPGQALTARWHGFVASEAEQGVDLNGDGDVRSEDHVLHLLDLQSGEVRNLGLATTEFVGGDLAVAFLVSEQAQGGADLNQDGDRFDQVLFVHLLEPDETGNLHFAGRLSGESGRLAGFDGNVLLLRVGELDQGVHDLNGDLDTSDFVLHEVTVDTGGG